MTTYYDPKDARFSQQRADQLRRDLQERKADPDYADAATDHFIAELKAREAAPPMLNAADMEQLRRQAIEGIERSFGIGPPEFATKEQLDDLHVVLNTLVEVIGEETGRNEALIRQRFNEQLAEATNKFEARIRQVEQRLERILQFDTALAREATPMPDRPGFRRQ